LLIEDEPRIRAFLARGLTAEGLLVDESVDGRAGLHRALEEKYDLVILDLLLPALDGLSVLRALHEFRPELPVLVLSARSDLPTKLRGFELGATDYLPKPFSFEELSARLRALVRRRATERPTSLVVGDLELDPATRQVTRAGTPIKLSPKGFSLLELFMRRPGEVLSRAMLLEHAWDFAYEGDSNVVDVYIRYLRDKIDRPFGRESIETVWGVGYRLNA
jgi:two-component system OmpR family response regulator